MIAEDPELALEYVKSRYPLLKDAAQKEMARAIVDFNERFKPEAYTSIALSVVLGLLSESNRPLLSIDCLKFVLSLEERSMRELADVHSVSVETVSNYCDRWNKDLGLPIAPGQNTIKARKSYSKHKSK